MMLIKFIIDLIVFIFLVTLKVFSPILSLRVGNLISNRIGHYAANTEIYLCEKEILKNNSRKIVIDLFSIKVIPVCNLFLHKMISRELIILPNYLISRILYINKAFFKLNIVLINIDKEDGDRDISNLFDKTFPHLKFTKKEIKEGNMHLIFFWGRIVNLQFLHLQVGMLFHIFSENPLCMFQLYR